jgi:hypothetical protein
LALIVGMFIIYNSFANSCHHRRSEIGILMPSVQPVNSEPFLVEGFTPDWPARR